MFCQLCHGHGKNNGMAAGYIATSDHQLLVLVTALKEKQNLDKASERALTKVALKIPAAFKALF